MTEHPRMSQDGSTDRAAGAPVPPGASDAPAHFLNDRSKKPNEGGAKHGGDSATHTLSRISKAGRKRNAGS